MEIVLDDLGFGEMGLGYLYVKFQLWFRAEIVERTQSFCGSNKMEIVSENLGFDEMRKRGQVHRFELVSTVSEEA